MRALLIPLWNGTLLISVTPEYVPSWHLPENEVLLTEFALNPSATDMFFQSSA
jgi:hypothetical protein